MTKDVSRMSPLPGSSCLSDLQDDENIKEWEHIRCPVCMEHPHNAILLVCSSHDKGCRPFMCDTSHRHSNCFDQFRKSFSEFPDDSSNTGSPFVTTTIASEASVFDLESERSPGGFSSINPSDSNTSVETKILCPLCRGMVNGWTVMESARLFMNAKSRSCACESCDFIGTYSNLRKHARLVHPLVRPTDADPERQRKWRRMEWQRDLGDLISTLEPSIGEGMAEGRTLTIDEGGRLTIFLLVRLSRPQNASRARGQVGTRRRRSSRRLWGETTDAIVDSRESEVESLDSGQTLRPRRSVRRRLSNQENPNHESGDNGNEYSDGG